MKVITAPENYNRQCGEISMFLAGGITNCPDWQKILTDYLESRDFPYKDRLVIFNPRRPDFDTDDPDATDEQIAWEVRHIREADIFTIHFCNNEIQPICLFELGKECTRRDIECMIVTAEEHYPRLKDIEAQTACIYRTPIVSIGDEYDHADLIIDELYAKCMYYHSR